MTALGFVPYSQTGLEDLAGWVPALRQVDARLAALLLAPRTAMGLLARMNAGDDGSGWTSDPLGPAIPGMSASGSGEGGGYDPGQGWFGPDLGGDTTSPVGGGLVYDPSQDGGGGGGLLGEVLGNPDAPGYMPNTPGNFDPANPGDVPQGGGGATIPVTPDTQVTLDAQARLAKWNKGFPGACDVPDYGTFPNDLTGVADSRFHSATASYQRWADTTKSETLPSDGNLDPATYASLKRTTDGMGASGVGVTSTNTFLWLGAAALAAVTVAIIVKKKKKRR
jgi:LPXTG-motif cell wall-anchored protein